MKVLIALPGLHRYDRGAEVAMISVARELVERGDQVTLIGSGDDRPGQPYRFLSAPSVRREHFERFPSIPLFRNEYVYEEFTFMPGLLEKCRLSDFDVTVTCSYPFTNWALRRPQLRGVRPPHVFVTQNGDWPAQHDAAEYRFFGCDGLVCTNPDFFQRNKADWNCRLIPNGIDIDLFEQKSLCDNPFGLPADRLKVLMVSALITTKRVEAGIEAVARIPNAHLVVAGDGPLRDSIDDAASRLLNGRFTRLTVPTDRMPALYQASDVFMHLSKEESFGNVFLEAMASGLPIVGHDSSRLRWIVGDDEYLLDTENIEAVSDGIIAARREPTSKREERTKRAALFSWQRVGGMYKEFLEEIIAARR
jgi:glycosyltransferase involved in cell wall biosynthesis